MTPDLDTNPLWWALAACGAILLAWAKKLNPRPLFVAAASFAFDPVVEKHLAPLKKDVSDLKADMADVKAVVNHLPGATAAKAAVRAEKEWV